jgi:hypothetical protein
MKKHVKIYLKAFGYDLGQPDQFVKCEITGNGAKDIHHIISRGKGGEDRIENLMALTRQKHLDYGDKKIHMATLLLTHRTELKEQGIPFDNDWFEENLKKYTGINGS